MLPAPIKPKPPALETAEANLKTHVPDHSALYDGIFYTE